MLPIWSNNKKLKTQKGISIIEVLVAIAIIGLVITIFIEISTFSIQNTTRLQESQQAGILAQEAIEATRNFRDATDWTADGLGSLATGTTTPYHPEKATGTPHIWELISGAETINNFTRKIIIEKVSRDSNDNIENTYNSSNEDPDTRKIKAVVSWPQGKTELTTYLTNWQK